MDQVCKRKTVPHEWFYRRLQKGLNLLGASIPRIVKTCNHLNVQFYKDNVYQSVSFL
jgi:hypothetical protein